MRKIDGVDLSTKGTNYFQPLYTRIVNVSHRDSYLPSKNLKIGISKEI